MTTASAERSRAIEMRSLRLGVLANALMALAGFAAHVTTAGWALLRRPGRVIPDCQPHQPQCGETARPGLALWL